MNVPEIVSLFQDIHQQPAKLFEGIRMDRRETVGQSLSNLMDTERTHFVGRKRYERTRQEDPHHRNGSYDRNFLLTGSGPVQVKVPRDRKGHFQTQSIARSKRDEEDLRRDLCLMFLPGGSTRSLSMISARLIGRKLSPTSVSSANKELGDAVEQWRTRDLSKESLKDLLLDGGCFSLRIMSKDFPLDPFVFHLSSRSAAQGSPVVFRALRISVVKMTRTIRVSTVMSNAPLSAKPLQQLYDGGILQTSPAWVDSISLGLLSLFLSFP